MEKKFELTEEEVEIVKHFMEMVEWEWGEFNEEERDLYTRIKQWQDEQNKSSMENPML